MTFSFCFNFSEKTTFDIIAFHVNDLLHLFFFLKTNSKNKNI